MSSSSRLVAVVASALIGLGAAGGVAFATPRAVPGCPGYSSAMLAAQEALRTGDRDAALRKLREARALLTTCGRGGSTASVGRAIASRASAAGRA